MADTEAIFTVKELFIEIRGKIERLDEHVRQLELRGTDREKFLVAKVENLMDRMMSLERDMASNDAVQQAISLAQQHTDKLRYMGFAVGVSILTAVGDFLIILFRHG